MFIPPALPDEIFLGYRSRIESMIGPISTRAFAAQLISATGCTPSKMDPTGALVHLGAKTRGMSSKDFVDAHSNYRINCPPGGRLEPQDLDGRLSRAWVFRVASTSTSDLRACPSCVEEDLHTHHFTFWHRSHHVPGRYTCLRHGKALHHFRFEDAGVKMPSAVMLKGKRADAALLLHASKSPHIARYLDFMDAVVNGRQVVDRSVVTASMRMVMLKRGEPVYSRGWSTVMAKKIIDSFSLQWLKAAVLSYARGVDDVAQGIVKPLFYDYRCVPHSVLAVLWSMAFTDGDASHSDRQLADGKCFAAYPSGHLTTTLG